MTPRNQMGNVKVQVPKEVVKATRTLLTNGQPLKTDRYRSDSCCRTPVFSTTVLKANKAVHEKNCLPPNF